MAPRSILIVAFIGTLVVLPAPAWAVEFHFLAPTETDFDSAHIALITGKPVEEITCGLGNVGGQQLMLLVKGQQPQFVTIIPNHGEVNSGDKLVNFRVLLGGFCYGSDGSTRDLFVADVQRSSHQATVLFEVDPALVVLADDRGVVTGNVAEDGSHKVVFVRKGGPNVTAWVAFNTEMELGDSLTEIEPIYADEYGTVFVATMEY